MGSTGRRREAEGSGWDVIYERRINKNTKKKKLMTQQCNVSFIEQSIPKNFIMII